MELAEEDLGLDDEEEEEWRRYGACLDFPAVVTQIAAFERYDEEVESFRELSELMDAEGDGTSGGSAADMLMSALTASGAPGRNDAESLTEEQLLAMLLGEEGRERSDTTADTLEGASILTGSSAEAIALRSALLNSLSPRTVQGTAGAPTAGWAPGAQSSALQQPGYKLPAEYRQRLAEGEGGGVVVSNNFGQNTVALVSRVADGPELLPLVTDTLRVQGVKILRGWLETGDGVAIDAFEVCDATTGSPLEAEEVDRLENALMVAVRTPIAREVLLELDGQLPHLDAFFGLPTWGTRPPPMAAVRGALLGGAFIIREARDLGRALVFRGQLAAGVEPSDALDDCQLKISNICPKEDGEWECLLATGNNQGLLLVVVPKIELEDALQPSYDDRLVALLCTGLTVAYASGAAPTSMGVMPSPASLLFAIVATTELVRFSVAQEYGVKLGLPLLLPSPALGTFGAFSCTGSMVPSATAAFDIAAAALNAAFLASFSLIGISLMMSPDSSSCSWVNPNVFPALLKRLVVAEANGWSGACLAQMPPGEGLIPAPAALIAGCFGAVATALNALPLARLDGLAIVEAAPWEFGRETLLSWAAFFLLASTTLETGSESLFPMVLSFSIFTFIVRPRFLNPVVLRDNATLPRDDTRRGTSVVLQLIAFILLMPSILVDGLAMASQMLQ